MTGSPTAAFTTLENHIAPQPLNQKTRNLSQPTNHLSSNCTIYRSCVMPKTLDSLWTGDLVGGYAGILRWDDFFFWHVGMDSLGPGVETL